jgi:hypothetical protein
MKNKKIHPVYYIIISILMILAGISLPRDITAAPARLIQPDSLTYTQYKGSIVDIPSKKPLIFATIALNGTNIATVSNSEGQFLLKVPKNLRDAQITVTYLGYQSRQLHLSDLNKENNEIGLNLYPVKLTEVTVFPTNPEILMRDVMNRRNLNYYKDPMLMTAFYRETIKKRRTYVSLSEAVVEILKQPVTASKMDFAHLYKARKSTDYHKLDTVAFKLQGGPLTNLMLDIMKNPDMIFTEDMFGNYNFSIDDVTKIGNHYMYVVGFKQKPHIKLPLYYGSLYIDTENLALTSAVFNLNVENREAASEMFIKKKPAGSKVYPLAASYHVNYREINGQWYYGYSRGDLTFKIVWKKRLFNRVYDSSIEMLVTDWEKISDNPIRQSEKIKPTIIMSDEVFGFSDPDFWGVYNVIEPEKPIESAIKKIQKSLERKK